MMMVVMVLPLGKFPFHTISNPKMECLNHRENILMTKMGDGVRGRQVPRLTSGLGWDADKVRL